VYFNVYNVSKDYIYFFLKIAKQILLHPPRSPLHRLPLLRDTSYGRIVRFCLRFSARFYYTARVFDFYHHSIYERETHERRISENSNSKILILTCYTTLVRFNFYLFLKMFSKLEYSANIVLEFAFSPIQPTTVSRIELKFNYLTI